MRDLEPKLEDQLSNLRSDIKQVRGRRRGGCVLNMTATSVRVRDLEPKIEGQLSNPRSDIKQERGRRRGWLCVFAGASVSA